MGPTKAVGHSLALAGSVVCSCFAFSNLALVQLSAGNAGYWKRSANTLSASLAFSTLEDERGATPKHSMVMRSSCSWLRYQHPRCSSSSYSHLLEMVFLDSIISGGYPAYDVHNFRPSSDRAGALQSYRRLARGDLTYRGPTPPGLYACSISG